MSFLLLVGLVGCQTQRQPNLSAARACASNLRNFATAVEMYHGDHKKFPAALSEVEGNYLKTLPKCTAGGAYVFKVEGEQLTLHCQGDAHGVAGLAKDTPSLIVSFQSKDNGTLERIESKLEPASERMRYDENAPDASVDRLRPE